MEDIRREGGVDVMLKSERDDGEKRKRMVMRKEDGREEKVDENMKEIEWRGGREMMLRMMKVKEEEIKEKEEMKDENDEEKKEIEENVEEIKKIIEKEKDGVVMIDKEGRIS